ncbi:hypothetical protein M271_07765 [Streptomyces rapamycinicus NRRL 5491]|uniref:hypothetical protein n=1 Tax=Streptomyces rapamycinicus TaxID=1226757 RepID=UPI0003830F27|nr:hypothetical protein M271_07765 [Streptomyces rapamycinicus NRRL 5491]
MDPTRRDGGLGTPGMRMASGGKPPIGKHEQRTDPTGPPSHGPRRTPHDDALRTRTGPIRPARWRDTGDPGDRSGDLTGGAVPPDPAGRRLRRHRTGPIRPTR